MYLFLALGKTSEPFYEKKKLSKTQAAEQQVYQ